MRVGIAVPVPNGHAYVPTEDRMAAMEVALSGRLGDWLDMHGLRNDAIVMEIAQWIVINCDDSQYIELLLGFDGEYNVEIISRLPSQK